MRKSPQALAERINAQLAVAKEINSDFVTLTTGEAKAVLEYIWPTVEPGPEELSEEMIAELKEQTPEERLKFCRAIIFDWDGMATANHLGELINEVYAWMKVPYKDEAKE